MTQASPLTRIEELSKSSKFSEDTLKELSRVYGHELEAVVRALKSAGKRYFVRVNTLKATPENVIARLSQQRLEVQQHDLLPEALWVPIHGPFDIPVHAKKVMVEKFTAESVLQGANVYAPGVVRCSKLRLADNVNVIDDEGDILAAGIARMNETQILTFRKGLAIQVTESKYRVPSFRETREFQKGLIYPQSLPAMLTSRVLDPKPGEIVLDMTCAPGGKLSHIAQLMKNQGRVIGVDRNRRKVDAARETCTRMGCSNVTLFVHDSRYLCADFRELSPDKVLVDPPCSALGIRPKVYEYTSTSEIECLTKYQKQFLASAAKLVKCGGKIVYSVCTLSLQECEQNALYGRDACGLSIEPQSPIAGYPGIKLDGAPTERCQRFHPHRNESGYFVAAFQKSNPSK